MKTLELKLKKDVLIVEAPLDAYDVSIGTHCIGVRTNENVEKDTNGFYHIYKKGLFFGDIDIKLEFLCKGSELTEEMASELVDETIMYEKHKVKCYRYRSYIKGFVGFDNAKESFISAVESKEKFWLENPIGNKPMSYNLPLYKIGNRCDNLKKWQEAEEKTFKNPLIFVKK